MRAEESSSDVRRLRPRAWDIDFLLMRELAAAFRAAVSRYLGESRRLRVVDYGCGSMPYRTLFGECADYVGADLPDNAHASVHLRADGSLPLANASADVVISAQVLEHVQRADQYLAECRRVLCQNGLLLLSTHGTWVYHPHPTDVRRWTRWGLQFDVEQAGFRVIDVFSCLGPLAYSTQLRLLLLQGALRKLGYLGQVMSVPICLLGQAWMLFEEYLTPEWVKRDNACVYVIAARSA
jgi:SAM-dependent methyltransferase